MKIAVAFKSCLCHVNLPVMGTDTRGLLLHAVSRSLRYEFQGLGPGRTCIAKGGRAGGGGMALASGDKARGMHRFTVSAICASASFIREIGRSCLVRQGSVGISSLGRG